MSTWNVETLMSVAYSLPKNLEIKLSKGGPIYLPAGDLRIALDLNEEEHSGYYSVKIYASDEELGPVVIEDLHYGREDIDRDIYQEIIDGLQ